MKKILVAVFILFAINVKAQLTFENSYLNVPYDNFLLIKLGLNEYKYFIHDSDSSIFRLYNLNHSLFLKVNVPISSTSYIYDVTYISRSLFDCDSTNIEYAAIDPNPPYEFIIFRTDGTIIQTLTGCRYLNYSDGKKYGPYYNQPIVNTPMGTKLILNCNSSVSVYSVCGTLFSNNLGLNLNTNSDLELSSAYPNPTHEFTKIDYALPDGVNSGEIIFYTLQGNIIKRFKVDRTFNNLLISVLDIPIGTYIYQLQTYLGNSELKKIIVIK